MRKKFFNYFKRATIFALKITYLNKLLRKISELYEEKYNIGVHIEHPAKEGWSMLIMTTGENKVSLDTFINSILNEFEDNFEIIVIGPPNLDLSYFNNEKIIHAPYRRFAPWSVPGSISKQKNHAAKYAKYDKLMISHDYLYFLPGWKKGFDQFGDFTVGTNVVLDSIGNRHRDWVTWDYPGVGVSLLPYTHEFTEYQVIGGNYFVVKRDFFLENPMNEKLRWGEGEDIDWGIMVRKKTKFKFNPNSKVQYSKFKKGNDKVWVDGTRKIEQILLGRSETYN